MGRIPSSSGRPYLLSGTKTSSDASLVMWPCFASSMMLFRTMSDTSRPLFQATYFNVLSYRFSSWRLIRASNLEAYSLSFRSFSEMTFSCVFSNCSAWGIGSSTGRSGRPIRASVVQQPLPRIRIAKIVRYFAIVYVPVGLICPV